MNPTRLARNFTRTFGLPLILLAGSCASDPQQPTFAPVAFARPEVERVVSLPSGTTIGIRPIRVVVEGQGESMVLDGLLREALRQSDRFDFAGGVELASRHDAMLDLALDAPAGRLTASLVRGDAVQPLTDVEIDARQGWDAIDRLAWSIRIALGEDAETPPRPIAVIYSRSSDCVRHTERALGDISRSRIDMASNELQKALRADPGCAITALAMIRAQYAAGQNLDAADRAQRTLTLLEPRCSITTQHRLARAQLLSRSATGDNPEARSADDSLIQLGEAYLEERPHDPDGIYTRSCGLLGRGEFDRAAADLRELRNRWPERPFVGYRLALAELALGRSSEGLDALEAVQRRLPADSEILPKAIALRQLGQYDELDRLLARELRGEPETSERRFRLLQYRAAVSVLKGDRDAAIAFCLALVDWLRERPSRREEFIADLRDVGESLIQLGAGSQLTPRLQAIYDQQPISTELELTILLLQGLANADDADVVQQTSLQFRRRNRKAYADSIVAAGARARLDLAAEIEALSEVLVRDDTPLGRARLARALREVGDDAQADTLMSDTRARLLRFDLHRPLRTPVTAPGRALAWLATESVR